MAPPTKRRRIEPTAVEEITFDPAARQDFLTGFHKRKLQRAKHAQEAAERRAREERIAERKKLREERKAELERHVQQVNAMLRSASALNGAEDQGTASSNSDEEWSGISGEEPAPVDHEAEYIDEDKYTTVTVEAMDVSREGLFKAEQAKDEGHKTYEQETKVGQEPGKVAKKPKWTKEKPKDGSEKPKRKKKRNFRYESKTERKTARSKEKSKGRKQARERRGGG
ncbi:hypothetical protein PV08_05063 [Exophiala spinifera]|uniref:Ribosomal RNA-processing protein 17 n=1 Tax=Exophiala spinifera TaxID=91928 RepID=A0A0D2BFT2_9EURO|nr:uncharacterized protein PV08_05063 [Exophiala spinifera]KIW17868.1 hypothetical protein PV08_05063 [Exophiala spinifera]